MLQSFRRNVLKSAHQFTEWCCGRIGDPVRRAPGHRRSIALTFDDGPSPDTLRLLEDLSILSVKATFFQCGLNVLRHPEIARAVRDSGHEIGNHTYSHARLAPRPGWKPNIKSPRFVWKEFAQAQNVFREELGFCPVLMRVPYGIHWFGTGAASRQLGLTDILWSVIGHDWEWSAEQVADFVVAKASPGAIICLHDGRETRPSPDIETTLRAVRLIVPALVAEGYEFETVSGLLRLTEPRP